MLEKPDSAGLDEARKEFRAWLDSVVAVTTSRSTIADKAAEIFGRKLVPGEQGEAEHRFLEWLAPCGTMRCGVTAAMVASKAAEFFAAAPQPTVIEGKGQAVRLPDPVWENAPDDDSVEWKYTNHSATLCCKYWISLRNFKCYQTIHDGSSWCISSAVTCKSLDEAKAVCWEHYLGELGVELEPRPAFVAPEKPELVLVRCSLKSGKQVFWATKNHAGDFVEVGSDNAWGKQYVEILNDKTGEVIA